MAARELRLPRLPMDERGLAFQFGVAYRMAQIIQERAEICAKLLELGRPRPGNIERAHRLLSDAMALHAAAERAVEIAEELE